MIAILIATTWNMRSQIYTLGADDLPKTIPAGSYLKDNTNRLNRFAGTWVFNENGQYFKITINKLLQQPFINYFTDDLYGNFIYKQNGVTISDTQNLTGENSPIQTVWIKNDLNLIWLEFNDPQRPKISSYVVLNYSNVGGVEKLQWKLVVTAKFSRLPNEPMPDHSIRVPLNCVLIKQ